MAKSVVFFDTEIGVDDKKYMTLERCVLTREPCTQHLCGIFALLL